MCGCFLDFENAWTKTIGHSLKNCFGWSWRAHNCRLQLVCQYNTWLCYCSLWFQIAQAICPRTVTALLQNEQFKTGCIQQVARTFEQNQVIHWIPQSYDYLSSASFLAKCCCPPAEYGYCVDSWRIKKTWHIWGTHTRWHVQRRTSWVSKARERGHGVKVWGNQIAPL